MNSTRRMKNRETNDHHSPFRCHLVAVLWVAATTMALAQSNLPGISNATQSGTRRAATTGMSAEIPNTTELVAWGYNLDGQATVPAGLTNVVGIAAGSFHNVVLTGDGTVSAWGRISSGQSDVPAGLWNVVAVSAGDAHSLALKSDGGLVAWGTNNFGQADVPAGLASVVEIASGFGHNLALTGDGTVTVWGNNELGQAVQPEGLTNVIAIAAGSYHNLALKADGTVAAWGGNSAGQTNVPPNLSDVVAIGAGIGHSVALRRDGSLVAWGRNTFGQTNVPADVTNVVALACGRDHSLVIRADGTVAGWGRNQYGQLGIPASLGTAVIVAGGGGHSVALQGDGWPRITLEPVSQVGIMGAPSTLLKVRAAGASPLFYQWQRNGTDLVGATNAELRLADLGYSHGANYRCAVSNRLGAVVSREAALTVQPLRIAIQPQSQTVLAGSNVTFSVSVHSTAPLSYEWQHEGIAVPDATNANLQLAFLQLEDAGSYRCVVSNVFGAVTSAPASLMVPPLVITTPPQSQTALALSNGIFRVAAEGIGPFTYQWLRSGTNLADGNRIRGAQTATLILSNVLPSDAGSYSVSVANAFGTVAGSAIDLMVVPIVAWGSDSYGQRRIPLSLNNPLAVAAGGLHNLALKANGTVVAWGANGNGETNVPAWLSNAVAIAAGFYHSLALTAEGRVVAWGDYFNIGLASSLSNVTAIAAGDDHSLALHDNGTVVAWGDNYRGQCNVPAGLTNAVALAAGRYHSLALTIQGKVVAWGYDSYGQAGSPPGLSNAVAIAAGVEHSLALKADGTVFAWGSNAAGQTNVPKGLSNVVAIAAGGWHSVALRLDGTVVAWGNNSYGQTNLPGGLPSVGGIAAGWYHSVCFLGTPPPRASLGTELAQAVDAPALFWSSGGAAGWFVQDSVTHDGTDAAQSGRISHDEESWLQTTVTGPGDLCFWWAVSSEWDNDTLYFSLDGVPRAAIEGESGWRQVILPVYDGSHTARWSYVKDYIVDEGLDAAWLDGVRFIPWTGPPSLLIEPLSQTNPAGSTVVFTVSARGSDPLSYEWLKDGGPVVDGGNITGAHAPVLTLSQVLPSDAGDYSVVVSNPLGAVTSQVAHLTVTPECTESAPALSVHLEGASAVLTWSAAAGCFQAEAAASLDAAWEAIPGAQLTNANCQLSVPRTREARYFRLKRAP